MKRFALKHFDRIQWYVSLMGMLGLGHLVLSRLDPARGGIGILVASSLVLLMACTGIPAPHRNGCTVLVVADFAQRNVRQRRLKLLVPRGRRGFETRLTFACAVVRYRIRRGK